MAIPTVRASISVESESCNDARRLVLRVHRAAVHFLHEQHQHLRRHQRSGGGSGGLFGRFSS